MKKAFLILFILVFAAGGVQAALKSSKNTQEIKPEAAYNPEADANDLELPMPNNLKLILRAVPIASGGILGDQKFTMGIIDPSDDNRQIYEREMPAFIGAPFQQANLPKEWQSKFPVEEKDSYTYYLIGKYELTNGQWAAVMEEESGERPDLPKTDISW